MKSNLPDNLTLDDFCALAERKPQIYGKWIYRLERHVVSAYDFPVYPKAETWTEFKGYFLTLKEAEDKIRELVNVESDHLIWGYCVDQISVGCESRVNNMWLYDVNGCLLDYTNTLWSGTADETAFFGRSEQRNRFKTGDIVEVLDRFGMHIAVLVENPPSPEWCFDYYMRSKDGRMGYGLDASDDCCYLLAGPGVEYHEHVPPTRIRKADYKIPDDLRADMAIWIEQAKKPYKYVAPDYKAAREGFYGIIAYISYDETLRRHYLRVVDSFGHNSCLSLSAPEYIEIEGHENNLKLNAIHKKALLRWLSAPDHNCPRWWYLKREWNGDEENEPIDMKLEFPDYRQLI